MASDQQKPTMEPSIKVPASRLPRSCPLKASTYQLQSGIRQNTSTAAATHEKLRNSLNKGPHSLSDRTVVSLATALSKRSRPGAAPANREVERTASPQVHITRKPPRISKKASRASSISGSVVPRHLPSPMHARPARRVSVALQKLPVHYLEYTSSTRAGVLKS